MKKQTSCYIAELFSAFFFIRDKETIQNIHWPISINALYTGCPNISLHLNLIRVHQSTQSNSSTDRSSTRSQILQVEGMCTISWHQCYSFELHLEIFKSDGIIKTTCELKIKQNREGESKLCSQIGPITLCDFGVNFVLHLVFNNTCILRKT